MRRARISLLSVRWLLAAASLVLGILSNGLGPAQAVGIDARQELSRALRNYGWRPEAIAYMTAHTHLVETQHGLNSPCPTDVACSLRDGTVYLNEVPTDPAMLDYVLNHEYIHAMEFARGSAESSVGPILEDLLALSVAADRPLAAEAARRALSLNGQNDHSAITGQDWFHLEHYVLEDVGWDVSNLPDWYRDAYFPYLMPNPPVRKSVTSGPPVQPRDWDLRMTRVLDAIVRMCGPILPGARLGAPGVSCDQAPLWTGVPYPRMAGGALATVVDAADG